MEKNVLPPEIGLCSAKESRAAPLNYIAGGIHVKNTKNHIWIACIVIAVFVYAAIFGCGDDVKGIREMRFGIDIRGGVEAVFEPAGDYRPSEGELESARRCDRGQAGCQKYSGQGSDG